MCVYVRYVILVYITGYWYHWCLLQLFYFLHCLSCNVFHQLPVLLYQSSNNNRIIIEVELFLEVLYTYHSSSFTEGDGISCGYVRCNGTNCTTGEDEHCSTSPVDNDGERERERDYIQYSWIMVFFTHNYYILDHSR